MIVESVPLFRPISKLKRLDRLAIVSASVCRRTAIQRMRILEADGKSDLLRGYPNLFDLPLLIRVLQI